MEQVRVSIIIPVYNTEAYLRQTLQSITGQTLRDIEIIVVDDGSTDGSLALVREIAAGDSRIRVYAQSNQGQAVARNLGLSLACGEYVYFMDSDDLLEPDALELCYAKCKAGNLDFVLFDAEIFSEEGPCIWPFDYRRAAQVEDRVWQGGELLAYLVDRALHRVPVWLNLISTDFLRRTGLNFHATWHEDELFAAQLYLKAERVGRIDRAFFRRRVRPNSVMTSRYVWRNAAGYLTVIGQLTKDAATSDEAHRATIGKLICNILNATLKNAWSLPLGERLKLARIALSEYPRYVKPRSLALLLCKQPLNKLRSR